MDHFQMGLLFGKLAALAGMSGAAHGAPLQAPPPQRPLLPPPQQRLLPRGYAGHYQQAFPYQEEPPPFVISFSGDRKWLPEQFWNDWPLRVPRGGRQEPI